MLTYLNDTLLYDAVNKLLSPLEVDSNFKFSLLYSQRYLAVIINVEQTVIWSQGSFFACREYFNFRASLKAANYSPLVCIVINN